MGVTVSFTGDTGSDQKKICLVLKQGPVKEARNNFKTGSNQE